MVIIGSHLNLTSGEQTHQANSSAAALATDKAWQLPVFRASSNRNRIAHPIVNRHDFSSSARRFGASATGSRQERTFS